MITISKGQAQDRFATLPTALQDAVFSEQNIEIISAIGEQYDIPDDLVEKISSLIGWVLLGFLKLENLPQEIAASTNLTPQTIKDITAAFSDRIFNPVKLDLEKVYTIPSQEEIAGNAPKIIQDINVSTTQAGSSAPLPINKIAPPSGGVKQPASSNTPSTSDIGWSRPRVGPDPVVRLSIPQGSAAATAARPAMIYPAQQASVQPAAAPTQSPVRPTTSVSPAPTVAPAAYPQTSPNPPTQNPAPITAAAPVRSTGGEFARLNITPGRSPLTGPAPVGAHPAISIPAAAPLPTGTPPTKASGFISPATPASKPTTPSPQAPSVAPATTATPISKSIPTAVPATAPVAKPTPSIVRPSTTAPIPASTMASTPSTPAMDPPPVMLHQDTTFKAAEKNATFTLSKPGGGAQMDFDPNKPKVVARPAVLEFGGVPASSAPKPPAMTSTPASNAQRYTEFRPSLSSVPTANTGPRNVSQILPPTPPVPPPVIPVPMPPRPTASGVPLPKPPQAPQPSQKPAQKDKVITKNFL